MEQQDRQRPGLTTLAGAVGVVTGAAGGIGAAVARALAAAGGRVVVADIDDAGEQVAKEVGGIFVRTDVRDPDASVRAVAAAEDTYGRLDLIHLNAGIAVGRQLGTLDVDTYRRIAAINLDGVVFGAIAALPALRRAGGGTIIATASLAGLVPTPFDPAYALTKHGVVGFVRSLTDLAAEGITANAISPGFADTAIIASQVHRFREQGFPLLTADEVAAVVMRVAVSPATGQVWPIQPGREAAPYGFRGVPGPRVAGHEGERPPDGVA